MKLLLIHQVFVSPSEPGGTRHYELLQPLTEQGHQATIVVSNLSYYSGKPLPDTKGLITEQQLNGLRVLRTYTYPALHRSYFWRAFSLISFMLTSILAGLRAGPVDLVMGTSPPIFQAFSAWLVATIRRRPFLLEIRDLWPEFAIDIGLLKNPVLIWLTRRLENFLYAHAKHILVNSPAYRTYLLGKGVPESKISVIPNGVDSSMFDPNADGQRIREQLNLQGKFVVTYAGALGMANDIDTILRAANHVRDEPQIHFLLTGDGKERHKLEELAQSLELTNVTFSGTMPKDRISEVLAASDACVATLKDIPMFRTTYPNKVFDYMAAGRPTILAIDGVIREVVEKAEGGIFVPPGDDAALASAAQFLCSNQEQAQKMGASARAYVVEHFDRHQHAIQFETLVRQVANGEK